MSVDVLREVFRLSRSKGVARNVLTALADAASPEGVTWLPIEPKKGGDPTVCITHRANASKRAVINALQELVELGELEVRKAQRGKARINVCRVVLGSIAGTSVSYQDLPFTLEHPFSDGVQILHVVPNKETGATGCISGTDEVQISSPRGALFVRDENGGIAADAGDSSPQRLPYPSREPSLQPSAADQELEVPAAEHPPTDREITDAVMSIAGADAGSPSIVRRELGNLPRSALAAALERARKRRGGVGLLIAFIRAERAERAALVSAQLAAELGATVRPVHRPVATAAALLQDDPRRYVRILAPSMPADLMREVLHGRDDAGELLALYDAVRAGDEAADRLGTPERERRRWVETHASDPDVDLVIDSWIGDAPADEVTELHELAEQLRAQSTRDERAA